MKKELTAATPLEEAIASLNKAINSLDEIIKTAQESQEFLKSLFPDKQVIGWKEESNE